MVFASIPIQQRMFGFLLNLSLFLFAVNYVTLGSYLISLFLSFLSFAVGKITVQLLWVLYSLSGLLLIKLSTSISKLLTVGQIISTQTLEANGQERKRQKEREQHVHTSSGNS